MIKDYTGLYRTIQDYIEEYRGLNSLLDELIKTGDRQTDTHTNTQNLWNLEVPTHLKKLRIFEHLWSCLALYPLIYVWIVSLMYFFRFVALCLINLIDQIICNLRYKSIINNKMQF